MTSAGPAAPEQGSHDPEHVAVASESGAPDVTPTRPRGTRWAQVYISLSVVLLAAGLVSIWVASSYEQLTPSELVSFHLDDSWCVKGQESWGVHCFGDFAIADELFAGDAWNSGFGFVASYPAAAWLPSLAIVRIGEASGIARLGVTIFVVLSAVALSVPALWAGWRAWTTKAPLALAVLGLATAPLLMTLDRANTMALVVPFLGLVAIGYVRKNYLLVGAGIVAAALLKPQMAILGVLLLADRRYRDLAVTAVTTAVLTVAGFLAFPRYFPENVRGWLTAISGYSGSQSVDVVYPYNLGVARSLLTVVDLTGLGALLGTPGRDGLVAWLQANGTLLGALAVVVGAAVVVLARSLLTRAWTVFLAVAMVIFASSTVYLYYASMLVVVAAMIIRDPTSAADGADHEWSGALDPGARPSPVRWGEKVGSATLVVGVALVMAPVVLPVTLLGDGFAAWSHLPDGASLTQVLAGPLILVAFMVIAVIGAVRVVAALRPARAGTSGRGARAAQGSASLQGSVP